MDGLFEIFNAIDMLKSKNVVGVGVLLSALIRVYRAIPKAPWVPQKYDWIVTLATFLVGFVIALLTSALGFNLGWGPAVMAALGVAVNAAGFNAVTKSAGKALMAPQDMNVASPFRKAASILVPPPKL